MFFKKKKPEQPAPHDQPVTGFFSTGVRLRAGSDRENQLRVALAKTFQKDYRDFVVKDSNGKSIGMDSFPDNSIASFKAAFAAQRYGGVPEAQLLWYGSQGFIGFQVCAMLAQHWLIDKACSMPPRDAVRNGYTLTVNDGDEVDPKLLDKLQEVNRRMKIDQQLIEFSRKGRMFGIRHAMFLIDSDDPDYYAKPFNIDGVKKGSYKGISQIDPYWISPELDMEAAADPASMHFQEPTWWRINGRRIHRTHLVVMKTNEVADVLKPSYMYAGVSIPQKIYERVYAAERTANEAPQLALTKRSTSLKVDMNAAMMGDLGELAKRLEEWSYFRDNFGTKLIGENEELQQIDTALGDMDTLIMSQYNLVAAIANMPVPKIFGTVPRGFNTTGEYEEASYHEELESIQLDEMTPFLNRHHELAIKSEVAPDASFNVVVSWAALDSPTALELATLNKTKAETADILNNIGAIDGSDERARIVADPESGYNNLDLDTDSGDDENGREGGENSIQKTGMSGQQITSLIQLLDQAAQEQLPPETVIESLKLAFQISDEEATALMGTIGKGFAPKAPEPPAQGDNDEPPQFTTDATDFDPLRGTLNGAHLITSQSYLDQNIVHDKRDARDFVVQLSPEFSLNAKGDKARVILDGHHSYAAAVQSGVTPQFKQMTGHDSRVKAMKAGPENMMRIADKSGTGKYFNIATKATMTQV